GFHELLRNVPAWRPFSLLAEEIAVREVFRLRRRSQFEPFWAVAQAAHHNLIFPSQRHFHACPSLEILQEFFLLRHHVFRTRPDVKLPRSGYSERRIGVAHQGSKPSAAGALYALFQYLAGFFGV